MSQSKEKFHDIKLCHQQVIDLENDICEINAMIFDIMYLIEYQVQKTLQI